MNIFSQNAKMKSTSSKNDIDLYNFGIPAFQSKTGLKTCPNAGVCASGCYARSGAYILSNVSQAYETRLELTQSDTFVERIGIELEKLLSRARKNNRRVVIRVHDSGDFYSPKYQLSWYYIAKAFPEVLFYAYTKQVAQSVALSSKQPLNFTLIYSRGGKQDHLIQNTDRHSTVFQSESELIAAGYSNASKDDLVAISNNPKIGLVYHGTKNYTNTSWSKSIQDTNQGAKNV
jgi:hypothetical protein